MRFEQVAQFKVGRKSGSGLQKVQGISVKLKSALRPFPSSPAPIACSAEPFAALSWAPNFELKGGIDANFD